MKTKTVSSRGPSRVLKIAALLAGLLPILALQPAQAGGKNKNPRVIPYTKGTAKTYRALSVAWREWQQGLIAIGENPYTHDPSGAVNQLNQRGKVWHLAGAPAADNTVRTCTIPTGKFIHFPIVNQAWITNNPGSAEDMSDPAFFNSVDQFLSATMTSEDVTLSVEVDGVALENLFDYFVQSPVFELPYYGSLDDGYLNFDYGYYILLTPLSAGNHTIHLSGSFPWFGGPIEVDVTYELTVVGG